MADTWTAESGILRKNKAHEVEELLVFGYSCKLFRDDEKALSIDQGKHLIPWMGDEKVKIDRYDGRGALADLQAHESVSHWNYNDGLTDEERRAEQLCDEERYRSLYEHVVEEEMYREEQLKRLHQQHSVLYGQVPFNYADEANSIGELNCTVKSEDAEDNEPYTPSPSLDIPVNMILPSNKKLSAIIERTAAFIAQQGGQMEVLLKAKQQHNPQFEFLNHDNELFSFYRHILMAIKTGRYKSIEEPDLKNTDVAAQNEDEASYYLHPSLVPNLTRVDAAPALPSIPTLSYKPSADCAYSMLVNKIKGNNTTAEEKIVEKQPIENTAPDAIDHSISDHYNQWNSYYNNEHYNEYYRQYYLMHYGFDPTEREYSVNSEIQKAPMIYKALEPTQQQIVESTTPSKKNESDQKICSDSANSTKLENTKKSGNSKIRIGALAHYYNSDSDTGSDIEEENLVPIPSESEKLIIVKMASYVAKNGKEFEEIVKGKNDPRFEFLHPNHKYHIFYKTKLNFQLGSNVKVTIPQQSDEPKTIISNDDQKIKTIGPVSFSIKKPKETEHITTKPALPVDQSSDEESDTETEMIDSIVENNIANESLNDSKEQVEIMEQQNDSTKLDEENKKDSENDQFSALIQHEQIENIEPNLECTSEKSIQTSKNDEDVTSDSEMLDVNSSRDNIEGISRTPKSSSSDDVQEIDNDVIDDQSSLNIPSDVEENDCIDLTADIDDNSSEIEMSLKKSNTSNDPSGIRTKQLQLDRKKKAMVFLRQLNSGNSKENSSRIPETQQSVMNHEDTDSNLKSQEESAQCRKKSKRTQKRCILVSEDEMSSRSTKNKKSKRKSHSHTHSGRTHKHRKHSKSNHHEDAH